MPLHGQKFQAAIKLDDFKEHMTAEDGYLMFILFVCINGGTYENPHYPKNLSVAFARFYECDLGAHIYAPGIFCLQAH